MTNFSVKGYSISNVGKEKNGDSFLVHDEQSENLLIALVADGVSQQPKDWLASETTCKSFLSHFLSIKDSELSSRILESVEATNRAVISFGIKMASTLSLVVWPCLTSEFFWCNIGDSRIYKVNNAGVHCLTQDDSIEQKQLLSSMKSTQLVRKPVLSKVIRQDGIKIDVNSAQLSPQDLLIIASDGFYGARPGSFNQKIQDFQQSDNFEQAFDEVIYKFEMLRGDDLTMISIKIS